MPDGWSLLLSLIALIILSVSGWLGGTLVYRNQIGVDHRYAHSTEWTERRLGDWSEALCDADELKPGQLMLVHIGDQRIAVGRCGDGLVAFSDHCTHRGGSLSDGALVGCTVQCPWHGSQLDVHNGQVVAGPAPRPIQTYALEVRAGQVYLIQPAQQRWAA
jgi:nitrite reductase/ring-hydroxylating ferredoxin subunit